MPASRSKRLGAVQAANDLLAQGHIDQNQPIDVFGLCEDMGLWLVFKPLGNLLGAFLPQGSGGVLVTTRRPIPLQRYTAAHELGHWALGHAHEVALDDEVCVFGQHPSEREQLAQLFAAHLLMPLPLAYGTLGRLGVSGGELSPVQAYGFARETGVSYEAALRHLRAVDVIDRPTLLRLLRVHPIDIKTTLNRGRKPADPRAEIWPVDDRWDRHVLSVHLNDEVVLTLPENRTAGYRWLRGTTESAQRDDRGNLDTNRQAHDSSAVEVVSEAYIPARTVRPRGLSLLGPGLVEEEIRIGGAGQRVVWLQAQHPGEGKVQLRYAPHYSTEVGAAETFDLTAQVEGPRLDASVVQLIGESPRPH